MERKYRGARALRCLYYLLEEAVAPLAPELKPEPTAKSEARGQLGDCKRAATGAGGQGAQRGSVEASQRRTGNVCGTTQFDNITEGTHSLS